MQKVVKGITGYRQVENAETHVILTLKEYNTLSNELESKINELNNLKLNNQFQIEELKNQFAVTIKKSNFEKDKIISDLQSQIEILIDKVNKAENLNKNLIRICRERANAKRDIKNKKKHNGYICLSSESYRFNNSDKEFNKILVETPYTINMIIDDVKNLILEDFKNQILKDLGYDNIVDYYTFKNLYFNDNDDNKYLIYKNLKSSFKTNLWTVEIYINTSTVIPSYMFKSNVFD